GCHPSICQRSEFFPLQLVLYANELSVRYGNEFGITARRTKPWPAAVFTKLFIPEAALTAYSVAPPSSNDHLITNRKLAGIGHTTGDSRYQTRDFMPWRDRELSVEGFCKVTLDELYVRTAHSGSANPHQYLVRQDLRDLDVFEHKRLVVSVHPCCKH